MEDDHVDRTGVEVQQCMKLTVTNRSIGLIVLIVHAHPTNSMSHLFRALAAPGRRRSPKKKTCSQKTNEEETLPLPASRKIALSRPGGHGGVAAPVPIPNTAVKRPSANGTSSQDAGE